MQDMWHAEAAKTLDLLRPYVAFNANIRSSFSALVQRLGLACASLLRQQVCSPLSSSQPIVEQPCPAWKSVRAICEKHDARSMSYLMPINGQLSSCQAAQSNIKRR